MNSLYPQLLSHGFTLKKVGETFMLAKDNVAFVQNGLDKVDAFILLGERDAKILCSDITEFSRVVNIYTGITGKQLRQRTFKIWLDRELLELTKIDTSGTSVVLQSVNHTVQIDKGDLYAILELVESNYTLSTESNAFKRILKRLNLL